MFSVVADQFRSYQLLMINVRLIMFHFLLQGHCHQMTHTAPTQYGGGKLSGRMEHQNLWAPWRMQYLQQVMSDEDSMPSDSKSGSSCFLCEAAQTTVGSDQAKQRTVLISDERGVLLLNRYPYTNGHLLVAPQDHLADLADLSSRQRGDLMELTVVGQRLLRSVANPQGFNVGMNLGRCAGAGLPGHLHLHVVPRWSGDTNFMQAVGRVRVIPEALEASYSRLAEALTQISQ